MQDLKITVEQALAASSTRNVFWERVLSEQRPETVCELGVWKGEFAEHVLNAIPTISRYYMVDPWRHLDNWNKPANRPNKRFEIIRAEALRRVAPFGGKTIELRAETKAASTQIPDGSLDFLYVDGDHTLRGITLDLITMLPKVRAGGLIGGDDLCRNIWQHGPEYSPTEVFPFVLYFAEAHDLTLYLLPYAQFLMENTADGFAVHDYAGYTALSPRQIYAPKRRPPTGSVTD